MATKKRKARRNRQEKYLCGIDVSQYQGAIAWKKVAEHKLDFAYIRSNVGTKEDERLEYNSKRVKKNNIPFGYYVYVKPELDAEEQVSMLLEAHHKYGANLIPQIDVEHHGNLHPKLVRQSVDYIVRRATEELGKPPSIYSGDWFWNSRVNSRRHGNCPLWVAKYVQYSNEAFDKNPVPVPPSEWANWALSFYNPAPLKGWKTWDVWQFAAGFNGCGKRYGMVSTDLDLNIMKEQSFSRYLLQ
jgi:GH25 family lysozyme M1 (1,4-beta-N-acetylmuramidase)